MFREVIELSDSPGPSGAPNHKKKRKEDRRRKRKHKDTSLQVPLDDDKYVVHMPAKGLVSLIQCICGSSSWDPILLTCIYCNVINHGSCYSILSTVERFTHVCGYCSVVYNVDCTDDSIKSIFSVQDLSSIDWAHIENEFLYKKSAVSFLMNEHSGFLGVKHPKELFLQSRFNISRDLALKTIGRLCTNLLINYTDTGLSVNRVKINEEFGLFQPKVADKVSFNDLSDYKANGSIDNLDRSRNDSGYSTTSTTSSSSIEPLDPTFVRTAAPPISISDVRSVANDSGFADHSTLVPNLNETFTPPREDNSRYNNARNTGPLADIPISKKVFERDGVKVRKFLRFPSTHPSLYNGPDAVSRKPDPVYLLEVGVSTIPLYGKLTHMLQAQPNSGGGGGFNCQLLLSMHEHAVSCRVWGDSPDQISRFQENLRIGFYYLVNKYMVNAKTYGKALPHTTIASLSLQCFNRLIPVEMVYVPVEIDQAPSTSLPSQEYNPQEAFAPAFVPVVQGRKAVKRQTEPNFRAKLSKLGSNLTSMRQVLHSHHSGNPPPPPPPTGARVLPPPPAFDPYPNMRITTGIISRDAPPQFNLPPPPPPPPSPAEHHQTNGNR